MQVWVNIKDKSGNFEAQMIKEIRNLAEKDTERLAKECESTIKRMIEMKCEKTTGQLADSWFAERLNITGVVGWGVGDIDYLNTKVPYWRHINYGSLAIGADWQHWLPKGRWVNGRWSESEDGYFAKPSTPIPARNYIENCLAQMEISIQRVLVENK
jgi:hypothetical protein